MVVGLVVMVFVLCCVSLMLRLLTNGQTCNDYAGHFGVALLGDGQVTAHAGTCSVSILEIEVLEDTFGEN